MKRQEKQEHDECAEQGRRRQQVRAVKCEETQEEPLPRGAARAAVEQGGQEKETRPAEGTPSTTSTNESWDSLQVPSPRPSVLTSHFFLLLTPLSYFLRTDLGASARDCAHFLP